MTHKYAECQCGEAMVPGGGCKIHYIHIVGETEDRSTGYRERVKHFGDGKVDNCRDCNAGIGKFHHLGCDWERCPVCGLQMLSCECWDAAMVDATILDGETKEVQ